MEPPAAHDPTCKIALALQLVYSCSLTQPKAAQVAVVPPVKKLLFHSSPQHHFKALPASKAMQGSWGRSLTPGETQSSPHAALLTAILGACAKANAAWRLYTCPCCGISPQLYFLWLELLQSPGHSPVTDALTRMRLVGSLKVFKSSWRAQVSCSCSYGPSWVQGGLEGCRVTAQTLKSASPGVLTAPVLLGKAGTHTCACTPPRCLHLNLLMKECMFLLVCNL